MCQGCETERRRKTVARILPVQISMWSQHLITVIPSEVEAATQGTKSGRPGFQSRGTTQKQHAAASRRHSTRQTIREIGNGFVKYSAVLYWLVGIAIAATAIAVSFHFDDSVRDFMMEHQNPAMRNFMRYVSLLGDWPLHALAGLALLGMALRRGTLTAAGAGRVSARNMTRFHPDMWAPRSRSLAFYLSRAAASALRAWQSRF